MQDELLIEAKAAAASSGQSLTAFIEEAIRRQLLTRHKVRELVPPQIPRFSGDGTLSGVDLDCSSALVDLMDAK